MKAELLTALAVALAPTANAEDFCTSLKDVVGEATDAFSSLKEKKISENNHEPYFYVGDAYECSIETKAPAIFGCYWQFDSPAQANAKFDQIDAAAKTCLAGWTRTDLSGKKSLDNRAIARGFDLGGSAAYPKVFVEVYTEPPKDRGSPSVSLNVSTR